MTVDAADFIGYLKSLPYRRDRAVLAALRRGLGKPPGTVTEMFPYVIPYAPSDAAAQRAYFLVAALFAWYPDAPPKRGDLGASFRQLAAAIKSDGAQRRFVALLRATESELPTHLHHAVSLLKAHEIGINWEQLLKDIRAWNDDHEPQRRWATSFWGYSQEAKPNADAAVPTTSAKEDSHDH